MNFTLSSSDIVMRHRGMAYPVNSQGIERAGHSNQCRHSLGSGDMPKVRLITAQLGRSIWQCMDKVLRCRITNQRKAFCCG